MNASFAGIRFAARVLTAAMVGGAGLSLFAAPFKDGDRVVFFGDSITHGGFYGEYMNLFYATRYPERSIWFSNSSVIGCTFCHPTDRLPLTHSLHDFLI